VIFHDVETAARRVGKTERTIRNWLADGLPSTGGIIREDDLLEHDRRMRAKVGRPRKATAEPIMRPVLEEISRQNEKWGEQNHEDGTGPDRLPLYSPQRFVGDDTTALVLANIFRARTDARFGENPDQPGTWKDILLEEVFEAMAEDDPERLTEELVQVEAVCAQWRMAIARRAVQHG